MSLNDDVRDLELRHSVGLQRLSTGTVRRILELLDRVDADLVRKLQARGPTLEGSIASTRLRWLLASVRDTLRRGYVRLGQVLRAELRDVARYEAEFQTRLLERAAPVRLDVTAPLAATLTALVATSPLQGTHVTALVADMSRRKQTAIAGAIRLGMVQGETNDEIVRRIRGTRSSGFRDGILSAPRIVAERIVRTAVNHVATQARDLVYEANDDLVRGWQWVATLDTRTCAQCAALDGEVSPLGEKSQKPPAHISCRCTTTPLLKSWRELGIDLDEAPEGTRASMDGQVSATETYQTWLRRQSAEVQDEALGRTRGRLFRAGGLSVDRFVDVRGNQLSLDQLRDREARAFARIGA